MESERGRQSFGEILNKKKIMFVLEKVEMPSNSQKRIDTENLRHNVSVYRIKETAQRKFM